VGDVPARLVDAPDGHAPSLHAVTAPGEDYTAFVLRDVASTGWAVHARITVLAPARRCCAASTRPSASSRRSTSRTCVLVTGADTLEIVAVYIGMLGLEFRVTEPDALVEHVAVLAARYARAVGRLEGEPEP
jgi:hypothetical protein